MNREELFDKFLQRSLTRMEAEELKVLLKSDPTAGPALVEHINEAGLMVRVASQMQTMPVTVADILQLPANEPESQGSTDVFPARVNEHSRRRQRLVALAACLTILAATVWFFFPATPPLRATIAAVTGEANLVRGAKTIPVDVGLRLQQGDIVQTSPQSKATIVFDGEATRAELQSAAAAKFSSSRRGKRVDISEGALEAVVAPQPQGRPLTLATLHAEARVLGTRLLIASEVSSTRLEVTEGLVEFIRHPDGQSLLVKNGLTAIASPNTEFCTRPFLPAPWASKDIGQVRLHGQARFDGTMFRLRGSGQDTCCKKDQLQYVYQTLESDGEISACIREIEFADPESRASLMIRQNLKTTSPQVSLGVTASGGLEIEHRAQTESRIERAGWAAAPSWVRLARRRDIVTAYKSADGTNWVQMGSQPMRLPGRAFIGLSVTSFNHAALSAAVFDRVNVGLPVVEATQRGPTAP